MTKDDEHVGTVLSTDRKSVKVPLVYNDLLAHVTKSIGLSVEGAGDGPTAG